MIDEVKKKLKEIKENVKYRVWEKNRGKRLICQVRDIQDQMVLLPSESDFLANISTFCEKNKSNIELLDKYEYTRLYIFKICLKNDIEITAFPWELRIPELIIKQEKQKPDGLYVMMDKEEMVKLYDIKTINVIRDCDEFKDINISEPMYGYKAIPEINGKLQAKGYEYRLNTPCKTDERNPYITDFRECYFHFCITMECVALCPGRTEYLESIKNYRTGYPGVIRLFRVKAEGHCIQYSGDWWVTNNLTVIEEVTKEEIYSYFMDNVDLKAKVMKHLGFNENFWNDFIKSELPPFIELETSPN